MKTSNINDYVRGWFIGCFKPSAYNTDQFEVGYHHHKKDEHIEPHYHKIAREINLMIEGKMIVNDKEINPNDIFIIEPNEVAYCKVLENSKLIVIKTASVKDDKYFV